MFRVRITLAHLGYDLLGEHKHFQYLTSNIGHPALTRHLYELIGMARPFLIGEWDKYYDLINRTFPKINTTLLLPFSEGEAK